VFGAVVTQAGTYCQDYKSVTEPHCDSTHCITVNIVDPLMLPDTTVGPYTQGVPIKLDIYAGYQSYVWTPAIHLDCYTCPIPTATLDTSTTYMVRFKDQNGCETGVTYRVLVFPPCSEKNLRIPNVFTPNGDDVNDVFEVVPHEGFEVVHSLSIYNRWGQKVFSGNGTNVHWDGKVDGTPAPSDVYIWVLEVDCSGSLTPVKGNVTLLR
ncbi:MAG: gliding motility-associated C-terminal domain-containing protein, partial [Bacteroidota bacterium]